MPKFHKSIKIKVLFEDDRSNRMEDSIHLFDTVCNNKWFFGMPVILLLNKSDIFKLKIEKYPLTVCFPEYRGMKWYIRIYVKAFYF